MYNPEKVVSAGLYLVDGLVQAIQTNFLWMMGRNIWLLFHAILAIQALCHTHNLSCLVRSLFGNLSFDLSFFEASGQW